MKLEDILCDGCLALLERTNQLGDLLLGAPLIDDGLCNRCVRRIEDWRAAQADIGQLGRDISDAYSE